MTLNSSWYDEHWKDKETKSFDSWWIKYYGKPCAYVRCLSQSEQSAIDEYYRRKAFALMGWLGAKGELK